MVLLLLAIIVCLMAKSQVNIPFQEVNYEAHYHCGLINVMIAHARVTLSKEGENFNATFNGNTIPWGGRVYCVSDTLSALFTPGKPYSRETVTYVNGWYMKPHENVFASSFDRSNPANYKNIKGQGDLSASDKTMEAIHISAFMLGLFEYYREIDFENMKAGDRIVIPVAVEGGAGESVTITYNGKSSAESGGFRHQTYSTVFEFTYGGVPSGYPVNTEVSVDSRLPVVMSTDLAIGKVELFLI